MDIISQIEAKNKGLKRYFTGQPCKHGHVASRFVSSRGCVECSKHSARQRSGQIAAYQKAYRDQTRDKRLQYHRAYYQANKVQIGQQNAQYREEHQEYYKQYNDQYYEDNRELLIERASQYRSNHRIEILEQKRHYYILNKSEFIARNAIRRARKLLATPPWYDHEKVAAIYAEAAHLTEETGIQHHVDHVVPLQGKTVCGLHWSGNLQVLTAAENGRKSNLFVVG